MIDIYSVIKYNEDLLLSFSPEDYPELARLRSKTTIIRHLYDLMEHMRSYSSPVWPVRFRRYFLFSEQHLADWNKKNGGSGDINTWQSHKIFLLHAGLIKTHVVIGDQTNPILQRIWETAVNSGYRSETLWSVPLFTPRVLMHADQIAKEYREKHVNLTHITKNTVTYAWDQKTADSLYRSSKHIISVDEKYVRSCLKEAMEITVADKGFTTLDELADKGLALCMRTKNEEIEYKKTIKKLLMQKRLLIDKAGYEYHRIRKRDREYEIPADHKGYIITKKE